MSAGIIFDGIVDTLRLEGSVSGPLSGTTFVAKDNFDVAGFQTGAGVPDWKRTHPVALATAPAVDALVDAGATLIGKSCMDELAFSLDGINIHYGTPANPNLPGCIPGGSSSGSAAAVAAGLCDLALGTDTAGSVRVPGAFCGILSMRPTHGRISTAGIIPLGPSFDTVGWFARNCQLFVKCGEVLLNETVERFVPSKIRLVSNCIELIDESLRQTFVSAAQGLSSEISVNEFVDLPAQSLEHWLALLDTIRAWEAWQYFGEWMEAVDPSMQEVIKKRFLNCRNISEADMHRAEAERSKVVSFLQQLLADQIICIPTVYNWPPSCQSSEQELALHRRKNLLLNIIAAIGGLPQVNIPISLAGNALVSENEVRELRIRAGGNATGANAQLTNLPLRNEGNAACFGLSFVARPGADSMLLSLARMVLCN